jgi:hypothetical protein
MAFSSEHPIPHDGSITPLPSAEGEVRAARHLFGRWPLVPSRELQRIRQILLHAGAALGADSANQWSDSARELFELVTAELRRRGQLDSGTHRPAQSHSEMARRKGVHVHGRSL